MQHLLSFKLHSSSFNVMLDSLNGSRKVRINGSESDIDTSCTSNSMLDVYPNRQQYDESQHVLNMNFVQSYTAILRQQKLLTVDAFRVQVRFGKTYFSCIFCWFQSRFNII